MIKTAKGISIKELREICQATAPNPKGETLTGRFCRIFGIYTTKLFLYTKITPNQITFLGVLVYFVGALMYFGSYEIALWGPFLYFLSIVIDASDGEVARFRKIPSKFKFGSKYVEPASHDIQYGLFFLILSVALFYHGYPAYIIIFGAMASISKLLQRAIRDRMWYAYYDFTDLKDKEEQNIVSTKRNVLMRIFYWTQKNLFSYPGTLFPLLAATIFNRIDIFLFVYSISYTFLFLALLAKHLVMIAKNS